MRLLHRLSKRERERKGPGLAPHIPMPGDANQAAVASDGLSEADRALLDEARARVPGFGPAARSRGARLAQAMREQRDGLDDSELLAGVLPVLCWLQWAHAQGIFPVNPVTSAVMAAAWELDGAGGAR